MTLKQAMRIFCLNAKFYGQNQKTKDLVNGLLQFDTTNVFNELKQVIAIVVQNPKFEKLPARNYFLTAVYRNLQKAKPAPAPMHPDVAALVNKVLAGWGHMGGKEKCQTQPSRPAISSEVPALRTV